MTRGNCSGLARCYCGGDQASHVLLTALSWDEHPALPPSAAAHLDVQLSDAKHAANGGHAVAGLDLVEHARLFASGVCVRVAGRRPGVAAEVCAAFTEV